MRIVFCLLLLSQAVQAENWPAWRGPRLDGTSQETGIPIKWSLNENIRWKTEIPGEGFSSPIVWNDQIFLETALTEKEERQVLCIQKKDGNILWQRTVVTAPLEKKHDLNGYASSTPATDGTNVYVSFLDKDKMLVAAYDFKGSQKWLVRPGDFYSMHGFCSSPILYQNKVIVNGDHDGNSYIVALDRTDGRTLWKTARQNKTRSYCVPIIRQLSGRTQMILSGDKSVASYDPGNGKLHWIMDGPTEQFVASVVYNSSADLLFVTGGFPDLHILGLKHDGQGRIGAEKIAWRSNKGVSYVPSPIAVGDYCFIVSDGGIASCFQAKTGKIEWQERLDGAHHASLVSAENHLYFLSDRGVTTVVEAGPEFRIIAKNALSEKCFASPAISNGDLLIRGEKHLFCATNGPGKI
jgi:outer membrane protein assembly factor BamB